MLSDRAGSIWLGFQSNGMARLRVQQMVTLSTAEGLPNEIARAVFEDSRMKLWIVTASGFAQFSRRRPADPVVQPTSADVTLMDLRLPGLTGVGAVAAIGDKQSRADACALHVWR